MADARSLAFNLNLGERFRRFGDGLEQIGRSPLNVALMRGAADDIDAGGPTAALLHGIDLPPGAVPALRLCGALHHLVLSGLAPELAEFYPTAGGARPAQGVWPVAEAALADHAGHVRERLRRGVQTNEVGRSTVLYLTLLWLTERHGLPIRLLEIGASAGLNLRADRYAYVHHGSMLGAADSAVRFDEPWSAAPDINLPAIDPGLEIVDRAGCDMAPLNASSPDDRLSLLSFIWGDEVPRFERARAALMMAADDPVSIAPMPAQAWLRDATAASPDGVLTVVWQSVVRQYVPVDDWPEIEAAMDEAQSRPGRTVVWIQMEPGPQVNPMYVAARCDARGDWQPLAACRDHGPPVEWLDED
jgi:hypothetical protein